MNNKIESKLELLKYIHQKVRQRLEEMDLYCTDFETTIEELEGLIKNEKNK